MQGKTHGKDIMLLCKGWYDKEKYITLKDALIAYYHRDYGNTDITPDYGFVNTVLLKPAIEELFTEKLKYLFLQHIFNDSYIYHMKQPSQTYEEELFRRLTGFLFSIRCQTDDSILVNTSDYWLKENGLEVKVDLHNVLSENII